jgi:hypothetical protein
MDEDREANLAGRWFGLRAEYEPLGKIRAGFRIARQLAFDALTFGIGSGDLDPKRSCEVLVYRLDDKSVIARYSYSHLGDATNHVRDLHERLNTEQVYDFCRDLNISPGMVAGPGIDFCLDPEDIWIECPVGADSRWNRWRRVR